MSGALHLSVTTPLSVAVRDGAVASLRAEDASGGFGILPGHADFLTVIDAGVLRWRGATGPWRFCALRGGVLSVTGGTQVAVACREAILGDDLTALAPAIAALRAHQTDAARQARSQDTRLHGRAIRRLMHHLSTGGDTLRWMTEGEP